MVRIKTRVAVFTISILTTIVVVACGEAVSTTVSVGNVSIATPTNVLSLTANSQTLTPISTTASSHPTFDPNTEQLPDLPCIDIKTAGQLYSPQPLMSRKGCLEGRLDAIIYDLPSTGVSNVAKLEFKSASDVTVATKYNQNGKNYLDQLKGKQLRMHGYISSSNNQVTLYIVEPEHNIELLTP